jgi:hypothetical protein
LCLETGLQEIKNTSENRFNHAIVLETNQDADETVLHWLKRSYRKQAGICIKLQMVFESIGWSTWLSTFQSAGYLQSSKNISIIFLMLVKKLHYILYVGYVSEYCHKPPQIKDSTAGILEVIRSKKQTTSNKKYTQIITSISVFLFKYTTSLYFYWTTVLIL